MFFSASGAPPLPLSLARSRLLGLKAATRLSRLASRLAAIFATPGCLKKRYAAVCFVPFSSFASSSKCFLCSDVSSRGSWTSTVAYRSPCSPVLPTGGIP